MAHVQMHQYTSNADLGRIFSDYGKQRREIKQRERESIRDAGVSLQNTQSRLDNEREVAKLQMANQVRLARMRGGFDLQLKQMGLDMDLVLQKLRNMNNLEIEEFRRETERLMEVLRDKNKQAQIVQTYKANLKLAQYNAKAALLRTYNEVMGDIYRTGDPLSNAADAAAYGLWVIAFRKALNMFGLNETMDKINEGAEGDFNLVDLNQEEEDEFIKEINKIIKSKSESEKEPESKDEDKKRVGATRSFETNGSKVQKGRGFKR